MIGITSSGIRKIKNLQELLEAPVSLINSSSSFTKIAGWGKKSNTQRARSFALKHGLPYISLEDGFVRSLSLGVSGSPLLSLVVDDLGIYYDSTTPSRLESLILAGEVSPDAGRAMSMIKKHHLSKYNQAPSRELPLQLTTRVLVIDQTLNDISVKLGGADENVFNRMLEAALLEHPQSEILVKTHPDVLAGKKKGYLTNVPLDSRIKLYAEDISPLSLLEQVDKVYVVTSQMGFEALMLRKDVICFGLPWYAGWGLTTDRHADIEKLKERRNVKRSLEQLFTAGYINYPRYLNPISKKRGDIFDVLNYLAVNKEANDLSRGEVYCLGMSLWKREVLSPFLESPVTKLKFVRKQKSIPQGSQVVSWGVKYPNPGHWRMEDGFLRSVGLGSDLIRPISLVLDKNGIYYDPFSKSDLDTILQSQKLDSIDLSRAESFKTKYVQLKMSKYNLTRGEFSIDAKGRKIILVPGQVEDDASIRRGSPIINTNQGLLNTVRENNPEAFIIYKPHPDVVVLNRKGAITNPAVADVVITDANIIDLIQASNEVHTMTSLSGFEALLHGKVVHCYGGPFYAGWGLTIDHMKLPHRTRVISLDELVFGAFIKYPRYSLPGVEGLVRAEDALEWVYERVQNPQLLNDLPKNNTWVAQKRRRLRFFVAMVKDLFWK